MLCPKCHQTEMTTQEIEEKMCYFCKLRMANEAYKLFGKMPVIKPPSFYGRSTEEADKYNEMLLNAEKRRNVVPTAGQVKSHDLTAEYPETMADKKGTLPNLGDSEIAQQLKLWAPDEPPHEFSMFVSDDFFIKVSVPGPVTDKKVAMMEKEIKRLFASIVHLKIEGSAFEHYYRDPDEPPANSGGGFPFPGM